MTKRERAWIVTNPAGNALYCGDEEWEAWDEAWQGEELGSATQIPAMKAAGWGAFQAVGADEMTERLGDSLKLARTQKGITLRAAAVAALITPAYLSQLENGRRTKPNPWILVRLAMIYAPCQTCREKTT